MISQGYDVALESYEHRLHDRGWRATFLHRGHLFAMGRPGDPVLSDAGGGDPGRRVGGAERTTAGPGRRGVAAIARPKDSRPIKKKAHERPTAGSVLPMELRVGDRFTDETGEWEIISHPFTSRGGKTVHVRVKQIGELAVTEERSWGAHERVAVRRA